MNQPGARSRRTVSTPRGPARVSLWWPRGPVRGTLLLGHGAGGSAWSADLLALTRLSREGVLVGLVEQPWRVAGRRVAAPPAHLDQAWVAVLEKITGGRRAVPGPLIVGGRSAGARVACRTAPEVGAAGVLALAFPLVPARRGGGTGPSRLPELLIPEPLLVVQGHRDAFGSAADVAGALGVAVQRTPDGTRRQVVQVAGDHSFSSDVSDVVQAARLWLGRVLPAQNAAEPGQGVDNSTQNG
ncbi:alpha/beta hydrolase family protein [Gephyromycinifex aptenodytis]|uniref:alpha/beta hydrolase family protein n=1 Tax=Gephyromycinifex aptenodytis TaxID=2716227 RepID=UPI00144536D1|nr:alpha/beta family hydrolase [Gephyromycinifex aptenodytis]